MSFKSVAQATGLQARLAVPSATIRQARVASLRPGPPPGWAKSLPQPGPLLATDLVPEWLLGGLSHVWPPGHYLRLGTLTDGRGFPDLRVFVSDTSGGTRPWQRGRAVPAMTRTRAVWAGWPAASRWFPGQSVTQLRSQEILPEFSFLSQDGFPLAARGRVGVKTSLAFSRIERETVDAKLQTLKQEYLSYEGIPICARKVLEQNKLKSKNEQSHTVQNMEDSEKALAAIYAKAHKIHLISRNV